MKKLLFALTLVLCLAISMVAFTSCGGNGEGDGETCEHIWATAATTDKAATCTEEGSASIKCVSCGESDPDSVTAIPATGHDYNNGTTFAPTCTEDGTSTKTCNTCGYENTTTTPATGHVWATQATVDVAATCTTDGSKSIKCTACPAVKDGTTEVIPAGHVWADAATVILPATCTTEGTKGIKCTNRGCTEIKPETTETIAPLGHSGIATVIVPTLFTEGLRKGTCESCGMVVNEATQTASPTVVTFSPDGESVGVYKNVNIVNDVLKGDHFYPTEENPNGKSLYIEFTVLWNETLLDVSNDKARYVQLGTIGDMNGTSAGKRITPYFLVFNQTADKEKFWCQYPGGFETDNNTTNIYGPKVDSNLPADQYTYIGDYGWHRIGIEYTQVTAVEGETVKNTLYATLYVDGVKKLAYQAIKTTTENNPNLLYSATLVNGELEYEDIASDRYAFIYRFGNDQKTETEDNAYYVVGDISVTCGTDFVKKVTKLDTPVEGTYVPAEGVELDADQHFAYEMDVNEKLYDETLDSVEYPVDTIKPAAGYIDYSISSGGTKYHRYYESNTKNVAFINVKDIAFNTVTLGVNPGGRAVYSFLSKMPASFNEVVSYAIEYRTFTEISETKSVLIPANAEYLVVYYQENTTSNVLPASITFTNTKNNLADKLKDNTLETLTYPISQVKPSQGTIASANLQYIPNFDWVGSYIDIRGCAFEQLVLEVNASKGTFFYAFLTQFPDIYDYVEFAGEGLPPSGPEEGQPAGTKITIDIPDDAVCLYIYLHDEGPIYYTPASIVFVNLDAEEPAEGTTPEDPEEEEEQIDGYAYPMDSIVPANGCISHGYKMGNAGKTHKYKEGAGEKVAFIDLASIDYDTVTVTSNGESAFLGFLTKLPTDYEEVISYAINYNDMIQIDGEVTLTIPANAKYIAVTYNYDSGTVCLPESIIFHDTVTPDDMIKNDELTTYSYPMSAVQVSQGTVRSDDNWYVPNFDWTSAFVSLEGCVFDKVVLGANANKGCVGYGFLTEYPTLNEVVSYAGGATAMTFVKDMAEGDTITVDIPDDAKVLVVYWYDWDDSSKSPVYINPSSITFIKAEDNTGSEDAGNTGNGGASEDAEENAGGNGGASEDASDSEDAA